MTRPLLTNKARLLLCVADECDIRMRELAQKLDITERTAYDLVCELVEDGYLTRERTGRRNCYKLHPERVLRIEDERAALDELRSLLARSGETPASSERAAVQLTS